MIESGQNSLRLILISATPDCLVAAARLYRLGDSLRLASAGLAQALAVPFPATPGAGTAADMAQQAILLVPRLSRAELAVVREALAGLQPAGTTVLWLAEAADESIAEACDGLSHVRLIQAPSLAAAVDSSEMSTAALDLGHPELRAYLWLHLHLAMLDYPGGAVLAQAVATLQERPFRLPQADLAAIEHLGGLDLPFLAGFGPLLAGIRDLARKLAETDLHCLITGEPGTGREALARLVHALSSHQAKPLLMLDCAGPEEAHLRSLLFGHANGAFPWAQDEHLGMLARADSSSLVLLNLDEMPPHLQAAFARAIKAKAFIPPGASKPVETNARILATAAPTSEQRIRPDLYYALAEAETRLPGLAEVKDDIPAIVRYLLNRQAEGKAVLPQNAVHNCLDSFARHTAALSAQAWPGNYAELIRAVRRRLFLGEDVFSSPATSSPDQGQQKPELRPEPGPEPASAGPVPAPPAAPDRPAQALAPAAPGFVMQPLEEAMRAYVRQADQNRGDMTRKDLAKALGVTPNTLYKHLKEG